MCLPNILFPAFLFAFIVHCHPFSPCWPLAFLLFSPPLWTSMFFFLRNSSPLFSITRSSSFSVIFCVYTKKKTPKKTGLCDFLPNKTLSRIWVAIPVDWVILHWYACSADGRSRLAWSSAKNSLIVTQDVADASVNTCCKLKLVFLEERL